MQLTPACAISPNLTPEWAPYPQQDIKRPLFHPSNRLHFQHLLDWHGALPADRLEIYGYWGLYFGGLFRPMADTLKYDIRLLNKWTHGCTSEVRDWKDEDESWDLNGIEFWTLTRLYWNPYQDPDQLRKYYIRRTYREAAPAVERFYGHMREAYFADPRPDGLGGGSGGGGGSIAWLEGRGLLASSQADLAEAERLVKHPQAAMLVKRLRNRFDALVEADLKAKAKKSKASVKADFGAVTGPVKPVNGVGQPPLIGWAGTNMFHYLTEAGVPFSRLHDVGGAFGGNRFVDIPNVFRDFDADENDPASYDFAFTDILLKGLADAKVKPLYRLGVTIENATGVKAYRVYPPKDYAKWARICEHVIAHYTEGWANGFRFDIPRWEIWNEADLGDSMWKAPFSEYVKLYTVAARHLKARFPKLSIGGPASCAVFVVTPERAKNAWMRDFSVRVNACAREFLAGVRDGKVPFDFYSMHGYGSPEDVEAQTREARRILDSYGFKDVPIVFNEWLPLPSLEAVGTPHQAALIGAELAVLQNGVVDEAEIYDARCGMGSYTPLFNSKTREPYLAYYVFKAFGELRRLGKAVRCTAVCNGLSALAATDGKGRGALFLVNTGKIPLAPTLDLGGWAVVSAKLVADGQRLTPFAFTGTIPADSVVFLDVTSK